MSIHKFPIITVNQNKTFFYLCSLPAKLLAKVCTTSLEEMKNEQIEIYQRRLDEKRVKSISVFLRRKNGIIPGAIILNSLQNLEITDNALFIDDSKKGLFFVIDGQHRISGAAESGIDDFSFPVVVFDKIEEGLQTELFVAINSEQKRVDPKVRFTLRALDKEKTPERVVQYLAKLFNGYEKSPFFGLIKMDDRKKENDSILSVSTFAYPIVNYIYDDSKYYELKDLLNKQNKFEKINGDISEFKINLQKYFLWNFYINDKEEYIFKILWNYFQCLKDVFPKQWGSKKHILTKTTGYNAFMILFRDIWNYCSLNQNNFSYDFMFSLMLKLKEIEDDLTVEKCGLGKVAACKLYQRMQGLLFKGNSETQKQYEFISELENFDWDDLQV